jgi:hypothetical protein
MPISFENFREDTYYLHSKKTKKGNTTYHFSKQPKGAADIEEIPAGFEIYEEPNGKVYLRKKAKTLILHKEIQVIKKAMQKYSGIKDFKLDIKKNIIFIHTLSDTFDENLPVPKHLLHKYKQYETKLRIIIIDQEERRFEAERYCT